MTFATEVNSTCLTLATFLNRKTDEILERTNRQIKV